MHISARRKLQKTTLKSANQLPANVSARMFVTSGSAIVEVADGPSSREQRDEEDMIQTHYICKVTKWSPLNVRSEPHI